MHSFDKIISLDIFGIRQNIANSKSISQILMKKLYNTEEADRPNIVCVYYIKGSYQYNRQLYTLIDSICRWMNVGHSVS